LICGRSYLGAEADLWSMGVLLYALLCGYLPFDDDNINFLYKKIQTGKYEVPTWLSADSTHLLNDLLQIDPKRRITMPQLVYHPWVLKGYSSGVDWQTRYYFKELEKDCVGEIALYFNKSLKVIKTYLMIRCDLKPNKKRYYNFEPIFVRHVFFGLATYSFRR
jgi:maternal embryonic leucine zipper kinase